MRAIRSSSRKLPAKRRTLFLTYRNLARKIYKLGRVHRWLPERPTIRAYSRKSNLSLRGVNLIYGRIERENSNEESKRRWLDGYTLRSSPFCIRCTVYDSCDLRNAVKLEQPKEKSKLPVERLAAQQSEISLTAPINLSGRSLQA